MSSEALRINLLSLPHWLIQIRPVKFDHQRQSLQECWNLARTCSVRWRGWDFPHLEDQNRINAPEYLVCWTDWRHQREYWRYYKSGLFAFLATFDEDDPELWSNDPRRSYPDRTFLEWQSALWFITEVYEFAARLAERGKISDQWAVSIELKQVKGRTLYLADPRRWWHTYDYFTHVDNVVSENTAIPSETLIGSRDELARKAAIEVFEQFQWNDIPENILVEMQEQLRKLRLG